jgi:hypothetical protein
MIQRWWQTNKQFSRASASNTQYKDDFKKKKKQEEGQPLHVDYKNEEPYNSFLTEEELDGALRLYQEDG